MKPSFNGGRPADRRGLWRPALLLWALAGCQEPQPAAPGPDAQATRDGMGPAEMAAMSASATVDDHGMTAEEMARMTPPPAGGELDIGLERLQSIGVRFGRAERRELHREIRTVGRVVVDERRLARLNVKVEGWIEELAVSTTGELVRQGQSMFTLYSPELVATQEEYLLALRSVRTLGDSPIPGVAAGARSVLEAARRRLEFWDIEERHVRELEQTGRVLRSLPIYAPLAGTVIEKMAVAGMHVMPGEDLYVIADLTRVWVLADIYEYELPFVRTGQQARITLSYDPQMAFDGRLTFVYPTLDRETRTARVRFEIDNRDGRLKPDMYANVALDVSLGERLIVPKDAVLEAGERSVIFLRRTGGKLAWREVRTGARAGEWLEVLEGLEPGEEIVTSANFLLDSESQVRSAMAGMDMAGQGDDGADR